MRAQRQAPKATQGWWGKGENRAGGRVFCTEEGRCRVSARASCPMRQERKELDGEAPEHTVMETGLFP